jgi:hypothetical protein
MEPKAFKGQRPSPEGARVGCKIRNEHAPSAASGFRRRQVVGRALSAPAEQQPNG